MRSLLKTIHYSIWLGLLTFLLVTTLPLAAQVSPNAPTETRPIEASDPVHLTSHNKNLSASPRPRVPASVFDRGKSRFEAGQFSAAVSLWQQAAQSDEVRGDRLQLALCLNYLSLAYQELGQWQPAREAISQSLEIVTTNQQSLASQELFARSLNTEGSLQLAMGQTEMALDTWKHAEEVYAKAGDETGILGSQINQAQALQTSGLYRQAATTLERVEKKLRSQPDSLLKATGLRSLGGVLQVVGDLQKSRELLEQSLSVSQRFGSASDISAALFSLGNTARASQDYQKASDLYRRASENATQLTAVEAQLNQLSLSVQLGQRDVAFMLPQIQQNLANLPPSRAAVYAQVNFVESMMKMGSREWGVGSGEESHSALLLAKAIQQARQLKDSRAESYALGQLGHLYEQTQQWSNARTLTQEALSLARAINTDRIAYRWQWQLGRILKQQGSPEAVAAYTEAVNSLQSLRGDLVAINPDVQLSFRESVEPVYRELVELLLQPPDRGQQKWSPSQKNLEKARQVIESLQLAELNNFFREACLTAKPKQIDRVDSTAAVIYPIILPGRLSVILSLPKQPLQYYQTQLPQSKVESVVDQMLQSLNPVISNKRRLHLSQQLYDWLIRPAETQLAESGIKTLVFVLDGSLRNLPMAALYDGQHYLLEKYSIALSPGLQLLEPHAIARKQLRALTAGLTEARQGFAALPGVQFELNQIASELRSKVLLNQAFTKNTLEKQIDALSFPVIHLATHAQFSSKAEDTFLLTWEGRINVKDLDLLLQARRQNVAPIELLVLSACQTAAGDSRATLGLAGLAVRSGARSTLAALWSVGDRSTAELMIEFYRELTQTKMNKAEALRQAQLTLLKQPGYQHPFYWAPYVLVGNWL